MQDTILRNIEIKNYKVVYTFMNEHRILDVLTIFICKCIKTVCFGYHATPTLLRWKNSKPFPEFPGVKINIVGSFNPSANERIG